MPHGTSPAGHAHVCEFGGSRDPDCGFRFCGVRGKSSANPSKFRLPRRVQRRKAGAARNSRLPPDHFRGPRVIRPGDLGRESPARMCPPAPCSPCPPSPQQEPAQHMQEPQRCADAPLVPSSWHTSRLVNGEKLGVAAGESTGCRATCCRPTAGGLCAGYDAPRQRHAQAWQCRKSEDSETVAALVGGPRLKRREMANLNNVSAA